MKWFQVDSDMPSDPKIRAVARALGVEGIGGLVGVWCHVARHGRNPGQGIDSRGTPFPIDDLIDASGLTADQFAVLVDVCTKSGHFRRDVWERYRGIWIPAMERRGDRYSKQTARQHPIEWNGGDP